MQILKKLTYQFLVSACLLCSTGLRAQTAEREYQIKAVFLFNFTHFVDWPASAFSSGHAPMVLGVFGKDPLFPFFEPAIVGEKLNEHIPISKKYAGIDDIEFAHLIFLDTADKKKMEQVIAKLKGRSVLTVGESPDFLAAGGMIRFYMRDNKIQLQVNVHATKAAGLVISSRLLRQVEIFRQKSKG